MNQRTTVSVREETVDIATYGIGKPDRNPMFLEKRVYQGSSGKVYPYPVVDKIEDDRRPQSYRIIFLENEYLQIQIMPELGGRIYRALDKTNQYDFVYYNRVIKPALVGLAGPWISGGIEFNWPQHHRPNTFGPVEHMIERREDGSATVWISEIDRMYGTKGMAGFTLHPGKAYLEITGQLYNRTAQPQTFLWWANPALAASEHTQSVFPPDVHAVFDHGKRDVSRFPIATGTYYKMDYSAGVDISRYKNIPVPTSYMVYRSDYNFVGGYDHAAEAGILHVADRHVSPGKKQWTWGNGGFGQAWDRNLTDEDGPYIELMTGVYTDNQPDFTWLHPYEEKTFRQVFMPYKAIGAVKNATVDAAVNLEFADGRAQVAVYATAAFAGATVELSGKDGVLLREQTDLSPRGAFRAEAPLAADEQPHDVTVEVRDGGGRLLVRYRPERPDERAMPEPAKPIGAPEELRNTEALFLAGQHLEQYRHATREPDPYYEEGLKRDPDDIRLNNAYGALLLRRGLFAESEAHFRRAVASATRHNGNPYDGEPYYNLGLSLKYQGRPDEAFDALYKATWSDAWQDKGFFTLAQIALERGDADEALELADKALRRNEGHMQARNLKTAALRALGRLPEARESALAAIRRDIADFGARDQLRRIAAAAGAKDEEAAALAALVGLLRDEPLNVLALAQDYLAAGQYADAAELLERYTDGERPLGYPMLHYYLAYAYDRTDRAGQAAEQLRAARAAAPDYCFPTMLWDLIVLEHAMGVGPDDARAHYYAGNLLYDKKRHADAIRLWERAAALDPSFPTVHRNLALAYYNKRGDALRAREALEQAFALDPDDARVFYELDQLCKKTGVRPAERLARMNERLPLVERRDDLYTEYVTLLNTDGQYETALARMAARRFHPWEGGEGKITSQYVQSRVELAKRLLDDKRFDEAIRHLEQALVYPENLGEGKLEGAQDNPVHYYLGCAYAALGQDELSERHLALAAEGLSEPVGAMYYNDQPPETIFYQGLALRRLGRPDEARGRFNKLFDYGEQHLFKPLEIDYFAVSLPDFLVFDDDLGRRNEIHCRFMIALGHIGRQELAEAREQLNRVLALDPAHQGALVHLSMCE